MAGSRRPEHLGLNGLSPSSRDGLAEHCTRHMPVPHPIPPNLTLFSLLTSYVQLEMKPREAVSTATSSLALRHCHERPRADECGLKSHMRTPVGRDVPLPPQCSLLRCTWSPRPSFQLCWGFLWRAGQEKWLRIIPWAPAAWCCGVQHSTCRASLLLYHNCTHHITDKFIWGGSRACLSTARLQDVLCEPHHLCSKSSCTVCLCFLYSKQRMTSPIKVKKKQNKTKELPDETKPFVYRLLPLDKRKMEKQLININPAAGCRAWCPGRMPAWHRDQHHGHPSSELAAIGAEAVGGSPAMPQVSLGHGTLLGCMLMSLGHHPCQIQELGGDQRPPCVLHWVPGEWQRGWGEAVAIKAPGRAFPWDTALSPALGNAAGWLCSAPWLCRPQNCPEARRYFVTASLEGFGITVEQMEENPPCKQDINF